MWSRSPSHTVAIFTTLKEGLSEPDALAAAAVGAPHAAAEGVFNMAPQDFLRSLPGVHPHNYRKLMNAVGNLQQLASQTLAQLTAIIGQTNGKLLHEFLHREA